MVRRRVSATKGMLEKVARISARVTVTAMGKVPAQSEKLWVRKKFSRYACSFHFVTRNCRLLQAMCTCSQGWKGFDCTSKCPTSPDGLVCGGNGECVDNHGSVSCQCKPGFLGKTCEFTCPGEKQDCSSHGQCQMNADGTAAVCSVCEEAR